MKKVVKKMAKGGVSDVYRKTKADGSKVVTYKSTYTTALGSKKPTQVTKVYNKAGKLVKGVEVVKNKVGNSQYDAGTQRIPVMMTSDQIKKQNSAKKTSTPVIKKPVVKKPVIKTPVAKTPEVAPITKKKESNVAPKAKTVTKPASGSATNTSGGKTVAQMWQEKTGTSWSEAKKQGLTDGSAKGNMKLMADMKANPSNFSKRDAVPEKLPTISLSKAAESLSSSRTTPELAKPATPVKTEKQSLGARIKSKIGQMKKGGMVKKKK
jgi:hypothetical protein